MHSALQRLTRPPETGCLCISRGGGALPGLPAPSRRVVPVLQRLVSHAEEDLCAFAVQMDMMILLSVQSFCWNCAAEAGEPH